MSKKTKTTTASTTTPSNPGWVTDSLQSQQNRINDIGSMDPSSFVTGPSSLQQQAYTGAGALTSSPNYTDATNLVNQNSSALGGVQDWMNPYTTGVVNSTLADFDANAGQTRAAQAAKAAQSGAFGGSRYGITEAQTEGDLARARATTESTLLSQGYDKATANALSNAQLGQQAGMNLASIGTQQGADNRSNIALQDQLGGEQRGIAQDMATAPITLAQILGALQSGNQYGLLQGSQTDSTQTTKTSDPMGAITSALGGVAGLASGLGGLGSLGSLFNTSKGVLGGAASQYAGTQ